MERVKETLMRLLKPKWQLVVLFAIAAAASLVFVFTTGRDASPIAYAAYVFSAYVMTVLSLGTPRLVKKAEAIIHSNEYSSRYVTEESFRTMISMCASLTVNLVYAVFKLVTAIVYSSFWFGAVAVYYIILCVIRAFLLRHFRSGDYGLRRSLLAYRSCGALLFALNATLTGVTYYMVRGGMGYQYPGYMIYAVAAYAFYTLTLSIINTVKHRKLEDPLLTASKAINLVTALVAMFTLQTAMFAEFGADMSEQMKFLANAVSGGAVCLFIVVMGVFMVVRGSRELKALDA